MFNMEEVVHDVHDDVSVNELFGDVLEGLGEEDSDVPGPVAALVRRAIGNVLKEARIRDRIRNVAAGAVHNVLVGARKAYMVHLVETNLEGVSQDRLTKVLSTHNQLNELYSRLNDRVTNKVEVPEAKYKIARDQTRRLLQAIEELRLQRIKEGDAKAAAATKRKRNVAALQQPELTKKVKVTAMPGARQQALLCLAENDADYHRLGALYEGGDKALKKDVSLAIVALAEPPEDKPEEAEKAIRQTLLHPVGKLADNMRLKRNRALYERVERPSNGDATHIHWAANADAHEEFDAFKFEWSEASKRAFLAKFVRLTWGENPEYKDHSNAGDALTPDQMLQEFGGRSFPMHPFVVQKVRAAFIEKHHSKLLLRLAACLKDAPKHQLEAVLEAIKVKKTNQFARGTAEHLTFQEKLAAYKHKDDTLKKHEVVHREVGLKLEEFPELLQWALETVSMDAAELKGRREAYRSIWTGPWHDMVRARVDAWLCERESIPAPKCKRLNGEVCRPLGQQAKEKAAEAAAEREETVQEKRKKHAAARAHIEEEYPHFGNYASEVLCKPELVRNEKAAQAVVARTMRAAMKKVHHYARTRAESHKTLVALNVRVEKAKQLDPSDLDPQGAEFSDDENEVSPAEAYWEARAAAWRARRERALYSAPKPLVPEREPETERFAPRSPSPVRETCPSKITAIEEQMDRYAKQLRTPFSMTEHEQANVQKLMAHEERRLPKGHKRKAADALDLAGR